MKCMMCERIKAGKLAAVDVKHPVCSLQPDEHEVDEKGRTLHAVWLTANHTPEQTKRLVEFRAIEMESQTFDLELANGNAA